MKEDEQAVYLLIGISTIGLIYGIINFISVKFLYLIKGHLGQS